jgi:DNA-binding transcriptional MocR family regulator
VQIELQREAGRPVYLQIADQIGAAIEARRLSHGERLPAIRDLARRLQVNRETVALAYEELAAAGRVESSVGRGTFVHAPAAGGGAAEEPFEAAFSALTGSLLRFERARPRFGSENGAVPLHVVVPDPAFYPAEAFRRALDRVQREEGAALLAYGDSQGHPGLREALAGHLRGAGIEVGAGELLLCHGASQGIALALRLFAEPGDWIALEEPTYHNALACAFALGLRTAPVPMGEGGPDLALLERTLRRPEVKLLYTIPTFHNPMGITTSLEHRRALLEIAARCGKPVVEDAYEMDLRFAGRAVPPLAALDASGRVVHLSSFSKSLFPGVRVGAIAARGRALDALLALKRATDHSDSMLLQAALARFLREGHYERHLARLRRVLRSRCEALTGALEAELPEGARFTRPEGGYQVWVELLEGTDTSELLADAARAGLLFTPGSQFQCDGRPSSALRLSFALADEAALRRGARALARVARERQRAAPAARIHI